MKYRAKIRVNGRDVHLGMYDTPEAAERAKRQARLARDQEKGKIQRPDTRGKVLPVYRFVFQRCKPKSMHHLLCSRERTRRMKPVFKIGYGCPHCAELVSWIPMPMFRRCPRCHERITWPEEDVSNA